MVRSPWLPACLPACIVRTRLHLLSSLGRTPLGHTPLRMQLIGSRTMRSPLPFAAMTTLDFKEFQECCARCGIEKYKAVKHMTPARCVAAFIKNLLGEENTEESMWSATLIKAERFQWQRYSQLLPGQTLKQHRKWLQVWQRMELQDIHYFPLWEKGVHDCLQKHFQDLSLIFLAYCRSVLGSDTAEDAMEMEMAEFKDFVDDCKLETKYVNFDLMTNMVRGDPRQRA